jgi:hypothetical protein
VDRCAFCPRFAIPGGTWALTAQAVDGSWRREILPLCPRCKRLIEESGTEGRVLRGRRASDGSEVTRTAGHVTSGTP